MTPKIAYDMPDDYPWLPGSGRFPIGDLGEHAARLNSMVTYDRRGELVWMDSFSHGLSTWIQSSSGLGAAISLNTSYAFRWPYTAHLIAGTTLTKYAKLEKYFGSQIISVGGLEVCFGLDENFDYVEFRFSIEKGENAPTATIRIYLVANQITAIISEGVEINIGTYPFSLVTTPPYYNLLKLVADFDNSTYVRLLINDQQFDLSAYSLYDPGAGGLPISVQLNLKGTASVNASMYLAHVILTANEP